MRAAAAGLLLAGLLGSCAASAAQEEPGAPAPSTERDRFDRMEGHFPDTRLVSHEGQEVRFYEDLVRGKKVVIQFMYTTCEDT